MRLTEDEVYPLAAGLYDAYSEEANNVHDVAEYCGSWDIGRFKKILSDPQSVDEIVSAVQEDFWIDDESDFRNYLARLSGDTRRGTYADDSDDPRTQAKGDCYEAAGTYMTMSHMYSNVPGIDIDETFPYVLVHGEVMGQGELAGVPFGHAWVINRKHDTVIDKSNGRNIEMPRAVYYALGQIDRIGNLHVYTFNEMREKVLKYKHWGPWDLETSTGL